MSAKILDCRSLAAKYKQSIKKSLERSDLDEPVTLTVVQVGHDSASDTYIRNKKKDCEEVGIQFEHIELPEDIPFDTARSIVESIHNPVIIQCPLPERLEDLPLMVDSQYDVDGLGLINTAYLYNTGSSDYEPCTPGGIMCILAENDIPISGQNVCIVGRSNIVGKPLAHMMMDEDATVTVCHSKTRDLAEHTRQADILVSAVGKAGLITADMVKPGAVVIDVGINRNSEGKLCGDVDFDAVKEVAGAITTVPGGVGLITRAMLLYNVLFYAKPICGA